MASNFVYHPAFLSSHIYLCMTYMIIYIMISSLNDLFLVYFSSNLYFRREITTILLSHFSYSIFISFSIVKELKSMTTLWHILSWKSKAKPNDYQFLVSSLGSLSSWVLCWVLFNHSCSWPLSLQAPHQILLFVLCLPPSIFSLKYHRCQVWLSFLAFHLTFLLAGTIFFKYSSIWYAKNRRHTKNKTWSGP